MGCISRRFFRLDEIPIFECFFSKYSKILSHFVLGSRLSTLIRNETWSNGISLERSRRGEADGTLRNPFRQFGSKLLGGGVDWPAGRI